MISIKTKLITIFLILCFFNLYAQSASNKVIDSLKNKALHQTKKNQFYTFIKISDRYQGVHIDSAKFYNNKAFQLANKLNNDTLIIIAHQNIGNLAIDETNYSKSLKHYNIALQIAEKINSPLYAAKSYAGFGVVNSRLGNFKKSIEYQFKCLETYEELKDTINIAGAYQNLAIDFRKILNLEKAIEFNLKAIEIYTDKKNFLNVAAIHNNLAGVYNENKEYLKAIESAEKANKYFIDNNYTRYTAYPHTNMAISYDSLNNFKQAKINYLKAINIHEKHRELYELAFLNNGYAHFNYKQKIYTEAIKDGLKALNYSEKINAQEFIFSSTKTLFKSYLKVKDYKNANKFLIKHIVYKDSLFEREKAKSIVEIQIKYETTKKEAEIAEQKKQLLENELAIKNRNLYALLLGSAFIILGIISVGLYRKHQFKRKQLQKEIDLKDALATIKTQNRLQEQRLRISRDLHDNIGSQLTFIISSIDNLKYISKDINEKLKEKLINISSFTSETIHELRDTIWAMNKSEISVEDLHARILSFIEKAKIAVPETSFEIAYDIDKNTSFSSLVGMNIFRVVQEAINNAVKYADAKKIEIQLAKNNENFIISVIDDGKGFDINTVALGNGLSNMEKRISEIDGKVTITSKPDIGTTIKIIL